MNIYARYFNQDTLVHNVDELVAFLSSIPDIPVNQHLIDDIHNYVESDLPYPKRYKIRPRVYFILIKTMAETMEDFKARRKDFEEASNGLNKVSGVVGTLVNRKEAKTARLAEEREGWYLCTMNFKRVIQIAVTAKFRYQDTSFVVYVYAHSGQECYDRIVTHLKNRPEIDLRSQFPSARGANFTFEYAGKELPQQNA